METTCQKPYADLLEEKLARVGFELQEDGRLVDPSAGFEECRWDDLLGFDAENDPDRLIGQRWLCRGMSAMIFSGPGKGKSSLRADMAVAWALGKDWHGLDPVRPLRSIIVQGENVLGDEAEILKGIIKSRGLSEEEVQALKQNLKTYRLPSVTGREFCKGLHALIKRAPTDLIWIDPLFHVAGESLGPNGSIGEFLRKDLDPVLRETGACAIWMHHTSKPPRQKSAKADFDADTSFFGGVELMNYARAAGVLIPADDDPGVIEFRFVKREKRTGLRDEEGNWIQSIWLRQASGYIGWERIPAPEGAGPAPSATAGKLTEYAVARRKQCTSASELPMVCASKLAEKFQTTTRTIYNWEKTYRSIVDEHGKYEKRK